MPKQVCRIKYRPGKPLGLSITPAVTFLDLSLELRSIIYRHCLVSAEPIVVSRGRCKDQRDVSGGESSDGDEDEPVWVGHGSERSWDSSEDYWSPDWEWREPPPWKKAVRGLVLNLLLCSKAVSQEAAGMFYGVNDFHFTGDTDWSRVYMFLRMIGPVNRGYLRSLSVPIAQPKKVLHQEGGVCTTSDDWRTAKVVFCPYPKATHRDGGTLEGLLDDVDPATEACFKLLGNKGPPLKMTLVMHPYYLPDVFEKDGSHGAFRSKWDYSASSLPMMVEHWRREYTGHGDGSKRIEVVWSGTCKVDRWMKDFWLIRRQWELVSQTSSPSTLPLEGREMHFVVRVSEWLEEIGMRALRLSHPVKRRR